MADIRIGNLTESVIISVRDSTKPDPEGWVNAEIAVKVRAWFGRYAAQFLEDDFQAFAAELRPLSEHLAPPAGLESTDGYLNITMTRDELGHVDVRGEAWDTPRWGAHLEFSFEMDQTYLTPLLASIETLLHQFDGAK
jgi:hypothetical protein